MYHYKAIVTNIVDGDTFDAVLDLGFGISFKQRFRVDELDTPETHRPKSQAEREHGEAATEKAISLLSGKEVHIQSKKKPGIYGRFSAVITLPDGSDYTETMRAAGFEKRESYEDDV